MDLPFWLINQTKRLLQRRGQKKWQRAWTTLHIFQRPLNSRNNQNWRILLWPDFAYISASTQQSKQPKLEDPIMAQPISSKYMTCILEFDGASKGNPGKAGAGAILKTSDGSVVARVREGLGIATNNVAEYRGLILGMKHALKKGFKQIQVQGDSKLICMQVQDLWQTKNQNMADLCKEVKRLKQMFMSFKISHVLREFNSGADNEANLATNLQAGEVYEESAEFY
ncbi:uncharacterized protein A4U43_C07F19290 [Asparagus officinalis]|uniref:RNase H type-1 domain-containing protein n=1 Tax=Asparagus officinalis TaxID=4686 RepID=A0A5P1EGK4_ASPOF|nr:uncharacterized protein A4U43_C07F19290 [Asparagus officinalis]